jgi:hypothetical protein
LEFGILKAGICLFVHEAKIILTKQAFSAVLTGGGRRAACLVKGHESAFFYEDLMLYPGGLC